MDNVSVRGMCFSYPNSPPLLKKIDFTLLPGETVILAGLSGSGKSTLAKILSGVIPRLIEGDLQGSVNLFGTEIGTQSPAELCDLAALVFQDSDEQMICTTVEDELAFGPENLCYPPTQTASMIEAALVKYKLSELRLKDPGKLSGGQKKLVALAAVSMMEPRLVIFDEPLTGLDEHGRRLVTDMIKDLAAAGRTVLVVEHDLTTTLARTADRWLLLADGEIKAFDTPQTLLAGQLIYDMELLYDD